MFGQGGLYTGVCDQEWSKSTFPILLSTKNWTKVGVNY